MEEDDITNEDPIELTQEKKDKAIKDMDFEQYTEYVDKNLDIDIEEV